MRTLPILCFLFAFCQISALSAQVSAESNFPGAYTIGLNAGWSYQSSDVDATLRGFGLGLTAGKRLAGRQGSVFTLDGRARLLYARQYGLDKSPTFDLASNSVLNGTNQLNYREYPASYNLPQGFAYLNHRTDVGELSVEALIAFNRLRERTGVHFGIFGGLGLDWYRARTNQADAFSQEYYDLYSSIDRNQSGRRIRNELRNGLDDTFESVADGNNANGRLDLMPSLGFELGYQFSPSFRMTVGHRITFSGEDELDGDRWSDGTNDWYHYTAFGLAFSFGGDRQRGRAPQITVTQPQRNPHQTNTAITPLRARITNVQSAADVFCRLNGAAVSFDFQGENLYTTLNLRPGRNEVVIIATNTVGKDREDVVIIYGQSGITPPPPPPPPGVNQNAPSVRITRPSQDPFNTNQNQVDLQATVRGVQSRNQVRMRVNNQAFSNFSFDARTGVLTARVPLQYRQNEIVVSASNTDGMDQDAVEIFVNDAANAPRVQIVQPGVDPFTTNNSTFDLRANIDYVNSASDIQFTFNGRRYSNFTFNGNQVQANLNLKSGENTVKIVASNNAGSDQDQVRIIYQQGGPSNNPPQVTISSPANNSETQKTTAYIQASVQHVASKNEIDFYLNGQRNTGFSFNPSNQQITHTVNLKGGANTVRIVVQNAEGSDEDQIRVTLITPQQDPKPPVIEITSPRPGTNTQRPEIQVNAVARHVARKTDLTFRVNGKPVTQFSFNTQTGQFSAPLTLEAGKNTLSLRGVNADGSDEATTDITYTQKKLPTVTINQPREGTETESKSVNFQATVQHVDNQSGITLTVNGQRRTNFRYNANSGLVTASLGLAEGANRIRITAKNLEGQASDEVRVTRINRTPPSVSITLPERSGTTVGRPNLQFKATTRNVSGKQQVQLKVNGKSTSSFTFNRGEVTASLTLRPGTNTIAIEVQNEDGTAEDETTVVYRQGQPPVVTILQPDDQSTTSTPNTRLVAKVEHITSNQQITVQVNGQNITNYTFRNGQITASVNLKKGLNNLKVTARNDDGSDSDNVRVTYKTGPPPPEVSFTAPAKPGTTVNSPTYTVRATTKGIRSASELALKVNGTPIQDFQFNSRNGSLSATITLKEGKNRLQLIGETNAGKDQDDTDITLVVANKPVVTILSTTTPASNPLNPNVASCGFEARVTNVRGLRQIQVTVNGTAQPGFTFDASSGIVSGTIQLTRGQNTLQIVGTNRDGSGEATKRIDF
jgi:hypothetical protein